MPHCFQHWLRTSHVLPATKNNTPSPKTTKTEFNNVKRIKNGLNDSKKSKTKITVKVNSLHQTGTIFGLDNILSGQRLRTMPNRCPRQFLRCPARGSKKMAELKQATKNRRDELTAKKEIFEHNNVVEQGIAKCKY